MSTLKIEERILVHAAPERVWRLLLNPEEIVTCLPGAGLDEIEDERNFHGNIKVKVGPVTVAYKGKATLTEVDDDNHTVTMVGEGKEKGGAGKVKMTMRSHLEAVEEGSEVVVDADVQLAGKVVRFGRGMIQGVSKEVFKQFGARLRAKLEAEEAAAAEAPAESEDAGQTADQDEPAGDEATKEAAEEEVPTRDASSDDAADAEAEPDARAEPEAEAKPEHEAKPAPPAPKPLPARAVAPAEPEAMNAMGLVFTVIWRGIANFFRRLVGLEEKD